MRLTLSDGSNGGSSRHSLLARIEALSETYRRGADPRLAIDLFRALGWNRREAEVIPSRSDSELFQYRLAVVGEPAALLFVTPNGIDDRSVERAVRIAYNSRIDWFAISNFASTRLLNARWSDDHSFFDIAWTDYTRNLDRLEMLAPDAIVTGRLQEDARSVATARNTVRPVDEDLLEKLESWRRLLLSSTDPKAPSDEDVQVLLGRLLFIRSAEDRGILPPNLLRGIVETAAPGQMHEELNRLFTRLAGDFNSELFTETTDPGPVIEDAAVADIIRRLYSPFPSHPTYAYDFSYFDIDLLGQVYERYVSTILELTVEDNPQQSLFGEQVVTIRSRSRRREEGIYYTPHYIADYIAARTVGELARSSSSVNDLPLVADISCGSGVFLTKAAEQLSERAAELSGNRGRDLASLIATKIIGIDKDPRAVTLARVNLWTLASTGTPGRPLPSLAERVFEDDSLVSHRLDEMQGQFDAVIGNPPFRSIGQIAEWDQRRYHRRYQAASGRFDLSYVFAERAIRLVRPGGMIGLVLPNRLFANVDARFLRAFLSEMTILEEVVDFGEVQAFHGATTYVSLVILRRRDAGGDAASESAPTVRVHRISRLSEYPAIQLRRASLQSGDVWESAESSVFSAPQPRGPAPWVLSGGGRDAGLRAKLAAAGRPLRDIADVRQGVKTGDNEVFLLRRIPDEQSDGLITVRNGLGEVVRLEPELLQPCATGPGIDRYSLRAVDGNERILYPYVHGTLLDLRDLRDRYPRIYIYLTNHHNRLAERATVKKRGGAWWDLSWSRASGDLGRVKVVSRDLVPYASFALDRYGATIPVGGVAVIPRDRHCPYYLLLGVMNSALVTWSLISEMRPYHGGHRKVTPVHLKHMHLPWDILLAQPDVASRIASLAEGATRSAAFGLATRAASEEIDSLLFAVLGLTEAECELVRSAAAAQYREDEGQQHRKSPVTLEDVVRALDNAKSTPAAVERERLLLEVRDLLTTYLDTGLVEQSSAAETVLVYALLAAQRLSYEKDWEPALSVLVRMIGAVQSSVLSIDPDDYLGSLSEAGIDLLPTLPDASFVVSEATSFDADDIDDDPLRMALPHR